MRRVSGEFSVADERQRLSRCHFVRQIVPGSRTGNPKSSTADCGKPEGWHDETIGMRRP
jgi:hypothetical protein